MNHRSLTTAATFVLARSRVPAGQEVVATMTLVRVASVALVSLCAVTVQARTAVQRDVEGYAIATCLTKQSEPYLKDQGDAWASVIVQRSHGDVEPFHAVQEAVEAELKKGFVPAIHNEADPEHSKPVPLLYCAEIIDEPGVRSAIDKSIKKLTPAYRRAKK